MNKKTLLLAGLALGCSMAVAGVGVAVGATHEVTETKAAASYSFTGDTVTFANQDLSNQTAYNDPFTNGSWSVQFTSGGNNGKYYNTGSAIRVYGGGTFVVSAVSGKLATITLTFGSGDGSNTITASAGTYSSGSWSGSAESVTFSVGGTSGHRRIASVSATLESTGDYTISTSTVGLYLSGDVEVNSGDSAEVALSTVQKKRIKSVSVSGAGEENVNWSYSDKTLIILEVTGNVTVSAVLEDAPIDSLSITGQKTSFNVGDAFSFGGTVVGTYADDANPHGTDTIAEADYVVDSSGFNNSAVGEYTITVTYLEVSCNYKVTVKAVEGAIATGKYYIYTANGAVGAGQHTNDGSNAYVAITDTSAWDFTLVDDDTYTISTVVSGTKYYLYATANNKGLRTKTTAANWTLHALTGEDAGKFELITSDGSADRWLCDYAAGNDFRTYKDSAKGEMYKLNITEEKLAFGEYLTSHFTCSGVTPSEPNGAITAANPSTLWTKLSTFKSHLSSDAQNILKTADANEGGNAYEQALARYDLIIRKYTTSTYADFLGRFSAGGANASSAYGAFGFNTNMDSGLPIVITIIAVGGVAAAGLFFLQHKRRKEF